MCNLIVCSASSFWDFRIPPFIKIKMALQIWPPSEYIFLKKEIVLKMI